jgi:2-methylcitrate dehydratase PrpD
VTASTTKPVAVGLAELAVGLAGGEVPAAIRERAVAHLLDTVGCGVAAAGLGAAAQGADLARAQGGTPEASLLCREERVPAALAAFANATSCHGLDFDDTHERGICHSSTVIAPTALALGEATGATGGEVVDAFVVGTEVTVRIAAAVAEGLYERGFHPTSVCGAFGAAATAARLLGLDRDRAVAALGLVGNFAAGLFAYLSDGSATKPFHAGWAAQAGVYAAQLAAREATGPARIVEGPFGLMESHVGEVHDAASIHAELGQRWELETISVKPFPACHFAHASTWAAGALVERHGIEPARIAEIVVRISPEGVPLVLEPLADKHRPRTPYDAKFSLPFTVAHLLAHGRLDVHSFDADRIADPDVLALAAKVRSEPLEPPIPSRFAGGARIVTDAGEEFDELVPHAPGSERNPLTAARLEEKFRANAALGLAPAAVNALLDAVRSLGGAESLESTMAIVRGERPGPPAKAGA